ncbi:precorrin-2 C(20)-methyltransferase [Lachnoclostridium phytofermentans]|uniref:Precorrin-2 C20-methyltransferase n=1 Tax=Lachnoclostridium phytofermentans (strain ATCC 700394 / DSM 18823 / ISDg) TaxID=357809 RepID=A9KP88_LACP7|nr:precorrin-2 C(20)-methyltransferase [Lachnoclostridium phytofermentans]ABX41750.1 precorrin-2 C20-methyltransferase [Lachnoclostridium phytofermentans ISDg]
MFGKLYGVGVGPGDPELLTIKAVRILKEADILAVPGEEKESSVAYKIASQSVKEIDNKKIISIHMPMTKDEKRLEESHNNGAGEIISYLEQGKNVAFLTLGDPTIYSTYIYLHKIVSERGYETEIISGIPSFCAVAAKLNQGLVEKNEQLHVVPSSYDIKDAMELSGTKVLMKSGKKISSVVEHLKTLNCQASMVENCGMENERIYQSLDEIKDDAGYYSLIIVKEN